jgi:hypothetical protein
MELNLKINNLNHVVRFEVSTAVTIKNIFFWNVTPSGSYMNDVLQECITSIIRVKRIGEIRATLALTSN